MCIEACGTRAQADREFVLEAVRQNECALKHAAPELKADREIGVEAVKHACLLFVYDCTPLCVVELKLYIIIYTYIICI